MTEEPQNPLADPKISYEVEQRAILMVGQECMDNKELVAQFNRLWKCDLLKSERRTPVEIAIDNACGVDGENHADWQKWAGFIIEYVWLRLSEEVRDGFRTKALAQMLHEVMLEDPNYQQDADGLWRLKEPTQ